MADNETVVIKIRADVDEFRTSMGQAEKSLEGLGSKGNAAGQKLGGALGKAFGETRGAMERYAQDIQKLYGVTDPLTRQQVRIIRQLEEQNAALKLSGQALSEYTALRKAGTEADSQAGIIIRNLIAEQQKLADTTSKGATAIGSFSGAMKPMQATLDGVSKGIGSLKTVSDGFGDGLKNLTPVTVSAGNGLRVLTSFNDRLGVSMRSSQGLAVAMGREFRALDPALAALTATQNANVAATASWRNLWGLLPGAIGGASAAMNANAAAARTLATETTRAASAASVLKTAKSALVPVLSAAGASMGGLGSFIGAARLGLVGLAATVGGAVIVRMEALAESIDNVRGRLSDLLRNPAQGSQLVVGLQQQARLTGSSIEQLAGPLENLLRLQRELQSQGGRVIFAPGAGALSAQRIKDTSDALEAYNNLLYAGGLRAEQRTAAEKALTDILRQQKQFTVGAFDAIDAAAPGVGNAIAAAFGQPDVEAFRRSLAATPRSVDDLIKALARMLEGSKQSAASVGLIGQELDKIKTSFDGLFGGGTGKSVAGFLNFIAESLNFIASNSATAGVALTALGTIAGALIVGLITGFAAIPVAIGAAIFGGVTLIAAFFTEIAGFATGIKTLFTETAAGLSGVWDRFKQNVIGLWDGIVQFMAARWQENVVGLWDGLRQASSDALDWVMRKVQGTVEFIGAAWNSLPALAQAGWDGLVSVVGGAVNSIIGWMNRGIEAVQNFLSWITRAGNARLPSMQTGPAAYGGSSHAGSSSSLPPDYGGSGDDYFAGSGYVEGGVGRVPSGYPNDTYRASMMLTEGEQVIVVPKTKSINQVLNEKNPIKLGHFAGGGTISVTNSGVNVSTPSEPQIDPSMLPSGMKLVDAVLANVDAIRNVGFTVAGVQEVLAGAAADELPDVIRLGTVQTVTAISMSQTAVTKEIDNLEAGVVGAVNAASTNITNSISSLATTVSASGAGAGGGSYPDAYSDMDSLLGGVSGGSSGGYSIKSGGPILPNGLIKNKMSLSEFESIVNQGMAQQAQLEAAQAAAAAALLPKAMSTSFKTVPQYGDGSFDESGFNTDYGFGPVFDTGGFDMGNFAYGGSLMVPPGYDNDSFKMQLNASSGETVSINRASPNWQPANGGGGAPVKQTTISIGSITIHSPKADDSTPAQIAAATKRELVRWSAHN